MLLAVSAYNQGMVQARGGPAAAGEQYGLVPFACRVVWCGVVWWDAIYCVILVGVCVGVVRFIVFGVVLYIVVCGVMWCDLL